MKHKFFERFAVAVLGASLAALPWPIFAVETGTGTNQNANLYATNSITLRGATITEWKSLTNSLDTFYIKNASNWSYYVAVSNVNLDSHELTNVAAMTLGGDRRTTWPISTLRTTTDQTINGTAWQDITGLTFPVTAGQDYAFDFYITFRSANAGTGFRFGLNGPAGTLDYFQTYQTIANSTTAGVATWLQRHDTNFNSMTLLTSTVTANVDLHCRITGRFKCTATGTFAARVASERANNDLVVQKGSWGTYF